jgi:transposase
MHNAGPQARLAAVACRPLILIEAPSSAYHRGMLVVGKVLQKRGDLRRFYPKQHPLYCGSDRHARTMDVCILRQDGEVVLHRNMQARPDALLKAIAPERDDMVIAVACLFTWYWLADLWAQAGRPCVLGHALSMQAIHGGKATNDTMDSQNIAVLLRGGLLPQAAVSPAAMRATRARLRRRTPVMRQRAEWLAHIHNPTRPYTLPEMGKKSADKAPRDGVAARCPEPAVPQSLAVDLALLGHDDQRRRDVERSIRTAAQQHQAPTLSLRRTVPGSGERLRWVLLYDIHESARFPRGHDVLASGRLVTCPKAAAGKRSGTSGTQSGHAHLTWACSEAAVLLLRAHPAGQQALTTLEKQHGAGTAWPLRGQKLGRAVYSMLQRHTACARGKFLHGSGSGADEPHASRDPHGLSLRVGLCHACVAASWRVSLRPGTRRSTEALLPGSCGL